MLHTIETPNKRPVGDTSCASSHIVCSNSDRSSFKKIPLTQGKYAIVDAEDFIYLNQWKWCAVKPQNIYYAVRSSPSIRMHRVIMDAKKGEEIDHINHNGLDNRRINLRFCTHAENVHYQRPQIMAESSYKGVSWHKLGKKWRAQIGKTRIHLGYFDNEVEAAKAYNKKAKELFGKFAYISEV